MTTTTHPGRALFGATNPRWSGRDATYRAAHKRLGRADDHTCACGARARQWAFLGCATDQRWGVCGKGRSLAFCLHAVHYEAKCVRCHVRFDRLDEVALGA